MACRRPSRATRSDAGSTHVLEAVLLSLVLLGAAYSVTVLRDGGGLTHQPRVKLEALTQDALVVLDGLREDRGKLLDLFLIEAYHCAAGTLGDAEDCAGTRSANMSFKLENYLPDGAGYAYGIANGVSQNMLYRSVLPEGEAVTASLSIVPDWNLTFVAPEMSCYESAMDVELLAMPVWHASLATPDLLNVSIGSLNATATQDTAPGVWRATLPAATRPAEGLVRANVTSDDGSFPGAATYGACALGGLGPTLRDAIRASTFTIGARKPPVGSTTSFTFDLANVDAISGVSLASANVTIYAPLPPHDARLDAYVPAAVVELPAGTDGTAQWRVPANSLYGVHPVLLTARVDLGSGNIVDLHRLDFLQVALPTGEVPIDPPYRAVLQTWFPDWR